MISWIQIAAEAMSERVESGLPQRYLGGPWSELAMVSVCMTALVIGLIRFLAPTQRVREARRAMAAELLGLLLYHRSLAALLRCEGRMAAANLKLILLLLPSLVVASAVFAVLYTPLKSRYGLAPLSIGSDIVIRVDYAGARVRDEKAGDLVPCSPTLAITARVRHAAEHVAWNRVRASAPGVLAFALKHSAEQFIINIADVKSPVRPRQGADGIAVTIPYAANRRWGLFGHWLAYFLVISLVSAAPLARLIRLRI